MTVKVKITTKKENFEKIKKVYDFAVNMDEAVMLLADFDATYIYRTFELETLTGLLFLKTMALAVDNDLTIEFLKD